MASRTFLRGLLDATFNLAIVTPLVVAFWSSSWMFFAHFIFPDDPELSAWTSFLIWTVFSIAFRLACPFLNAHCNRPLIRAVLWRSLLYPASLAVVNCWLGIWSLWDHYTGKELQSCFISVGVGILILLLIRQTLTIVAPPFTAGRDSVSPQFVLYNRWEDEGNNRNILFKMLDHFVAYIVTGVGIVSFWRGTWGVHDNLLFPNPSDFVRSAYTSLACGYTMFLLGYCSQAFYKNFAEKRSRIIRYLLEVLWVLLMGVASVMCWRGAWYLFDAFVFPDDVLIRVGILHSLAVVVMFIVGCFSSIAAPPTFGCSMGLDGTAELNGLAMGTVLPKMMMDRRVAAEEAGEKPVALQENAGMEEHEIQQMPPENHAHVN